MIRAIIIDDEIKAVESLKMLISEYCKEIEIIGVAHNVTEGIKLIQKTNPDLLFLDVEMPGGTGFDILEKTKEQNFVIIFTTGFNHYAIEALRHNALDYLVKPIKIEELENAVRKATQQINKKDFPKDSYNKILSGIKEKISSKLAVSTMKGIEFIEIHDIIQIVAERRYSVLHLVEGRKIMVAKSLAEYERQLSDLPFFRSHKSHLINIEHIKRYIHKGRIIELSDSSKAFLSHAKLNDFKILMENIHR